VVSAGPSSVGSEKGDNDGPGILPFALGGLGLLGLSEAGSQSLPVPTPVPVPVPTPEPVPTPVPVPTPTPVPTPVPVPTPTPVPVPTPEPVPIPVPTPTPVPVPTVILDQADDLRDRVDDGTVILQTSLSAIDALGIVRIESADLGASPGNGVDSVVITGGVGVGFKFNTSPLTFQQELDVTLQLSGFDRRDPVSNGQGGFRLETADEADSTVVLKTSLGHLAAMGIDQIEAGGGSGVKSVIVSGGIDAFGDSDYPLPTFQQELDVHLKMTAADDQGSDGAADGTVVLNTSLGAVAGIGIDRIEAAPDSGIGSVVVTGGLGGFNFSQPAFSQPAVAFEQSLDVTLQLVQADDEATDGAEDGAVVLDASLGSLVAMGLDRIEAGADSGVESIVITGGLGGLDLSQSSISFDEPLDVALRLTTADDLSTDAVADGTVTLHTTLTSFLGMGIDRLESTQGSGVDSVVITGVGSGLDVARDQTIDLAGVDLRLEMNESEIGALVGLIDAGLHFQGDASLVVDGTSLGDLSLSKLANLGIDKVKLSPQPKGEVSIDLGLQDVGEHLVSSLQALVDRFEPGQPLFDDVLDVKLYIGHNDLSALPGAPKLLEQIKLLGIDMIDDGHADQAATKPLDLNKQLLG